MIVVCVTIVATIFFNQSTYSINEHDQLAQLVLVLNNPSSFDFKVEIIDTSIVRGESLTSSSCSAD